MVYKFICYVRVEEYNLIKNESFLELVNSCAFSEQPSFPEMSFSKLISEMTVAQKSTRIYQLEKNKCKVDSQRNAKDRIEKKVHVQYIRLNKPEISKNEVNDVAKQ